MKPITQLMTFTIAETKMIPRKMKSGNGKCFYHFKMVLRIDPKAEHVGGMNLFGKHFGDYSQDIVLKVEYE